MLRWWNRQGIVGECDSNKPTLLSGSGRLPPILDSTRMAGIDKCKKALAICAENIGDLGALFCGTKCAFSSCGTRHLWRLYFKIFGTACEWR